MKSHLLAALAAFLLAIVAGHPAKAGAFGTGCYVEGSAGLGLADVEASAGGASVDFSGEGFIGGLGAGCDYRLGGFLVGVLGGVDLSTVDIKALGAKVTEDPTYRVLARVGFNPADNLLVYALAGGAWTKLDAKGAGSQSFEGFTVGAGADFALNDSWTLGARYMVDLLGSEGGGGVSVEPNRHTIRAVIGYRF